MAHSTAALKRGISRAALWLALVVPLASCGGPQGEISNLQGKPETLLREDRLDHGFTVSFTLTNRGAEGALTVSPWLSCSEGRWTRSQELQLSAGETVNLEYSFHEPTINATNFQFGVKLEP